MFWFPNHTSLHDRITRLEHWRRSMTNQVGDLDHALRDLKDALAAAVDRIDAKLAALADNNPDLTSEIDDIRADAALVAGLAADPAPAPGATFDDTGTAPTQPPLPTEEPPPTTDTPPAGS